MSPLAIVASIPQGFYSRLKSKPERDGWRIEIIPSSHPRKADLGTVWKRVMGRADAADADGVHLLLSHHRDDHRPRFQSQASNTHRVIWISSDFRSGMFNFHETVDCALDFEDEWRKQIRPGPNSPLLLPETAFSANKSVSDMWHRVKMVSRDADVLRHVRNIIRRFRERHWEGQSWRDEANLNFRRQTDHGLHIPAFRQWKFTFNLPDGFHFDVKHADERHGFDIRDQRGEVRHFKQYTNVDPHGYLRGGY